MKTGTSARPHALSAAALLRFGLGYGKEVGGSLMLAVRRWQRDDVGSMAASVAYYLALSLFPMLLLLTSGLGIALRFTRLGQDAEHHILAIVAEHCSPSLEAQVRDVLLQFEDQSLVGGPFGLITATLAAIGVFYQFERAFDKIWRIPTPPSRGMLHVVVNVCTKRLTAFLLLGCVGLTMLAILAFNVALGFVREWMTSLHLPGTGLLALVDAMATTITNSLAFGMMFRWLPKKPVRWSDALRGGLLVAIIWEVGRQVLSAFLIGMRYATAYGAIGSFIGLLLWFYWGVTMLFFGAEYVQVLSRRHAKPLRMFEPHEQSDCYTPAGERLSPRRAA